MDFIINHKIELILIVFFVCTLTVLTVNACQELDNEIIKRHPKRGNKWLLLYLEKKYL
jgi:hypothetical protein